MHSKGGNGTNIADSFRAGKASELPKLTRLGKKAEPLNTGILASVRSLLTAADGMIASSLLYTATADELTAYNKDAKESGREPVDVVTLAKRIAYNESAPIRRYAMAVAKTLPSKTQSGKSMSISVRLVNEQKAAGAAPAIRWNILLSEPREEKATPAVTA